MTGADPITWGAVLILLTICGAVAKFYHSLQREVEVAKEGTRAVENKLSSYQLTVAETYISKKDLQGSLSPLMDHVSTVKDSVDKISTRFDRFLEIQASAPARRTTARNT